MPPTPTISAGRAAERWSRRASGASQDYQTGIEQARTSWQRASTAAAANYQAGVTAAAGRGAYARGIATAGDERWRRRAAGVGVSRFSQGVQESQGDYATAIQPVLDAIGRVDLPPRGPVGSDGNYNRSAAIGRALRQLRTGAAK